MDADMNAGVPATALLANGRALVSWFDVFLPSMWRPNPRLETVSRMGGEFIPEPGLASALSGATSTLGSARIGDSLADLEGQDERE
jgi:hypothetical protein